MLNEEIQKKWAPILEHEDLFPIKDNHRKAVTALMIENTVNAMRESGALQPGGLLQENPIPANYMGASSSTPGDGNIDIFDPVLISMVRRSMPNLMAYDVAGVQPMTGPVGLIFAMRARYANQTHTETFYNEVNTQHSSVTSGANVAGQKHAGSIPGNNTVSANLAETGIYNYGSAMPTAQAEALGTTGNTAWPEMALSIEKISVTAESRALKSEYTQELAQDLKAVHGMDAETELSNILSTELLTEINREVIRTINFVAKQGAQENVATTGFFDLDTDSNGRWSVEKFKGLHFHVEREANRIAKDTRRGKGNILICSSDVASALQSAGVLDYAPALNSNNLNPDDTGNTFAGVLNGRFRVYIDPYADAIADGFPGLNYMTVGYKGASAMDAGLFYCPYVPLQMVRAVDHDSFQPKIGFKTRYGMVANPFAGGETAQAGVLTKDSNVYYRRVLVKNLM